MLLSVNLSLNHSRPGGEGSVWGPEAGDAPGPSFPEGLLDELALRGRVYPPEGTFARLLLRPRHFDEVTVQRQVVTDRVLHFKKRQHVILAVLKASSDRPTPGRSSPASPCLQSCSTGSSL